MTECQEGAGGEDQRRRALSSVYWKHNLLLIKKGRITLFCLALATVFTLKQAGQQQYVPRAHKSVHNIRLWERPASVCNTALLARTVRSHLDPGLRSTAQAVIGLWGQMIGRRLCEGQEKECTFGY